MNSYSLLVELQNHLKREEKSRYDQKSNFYFKLIKTKIYYLRQCLIKTFRSSTSKFESPLKNFNFDEFNNCKELLKYEIPEFFNRNRLAETLNSMEAFLKNNQAFLDFLTFGTLPALFNMFLEDNDLNDFITFIKNLKPNGHEGEKLQIIFSRCLILLPDFISFIQKSFTPIFDHYLNGKISTIHECVLSNEIRCVQKKLLQSIQENMTHFPISIKMYIDAMDEVGLNHEKFLSEALFSPMALSPESFLVLSFYETDLFGDLPKVTSFFQKVFNSDFIRSFLQIINESTTFKKNSIQQKLITDDLSYFRYLKVVDSFDLIIFDSILNHKRIDFYGVLNQNEKYSLYFANFQSESPQINELLVFRKLIKKIPIFPESTDIQSIKDIILHVSTQITLESRINYYLLNDFLSNKLPNMNLNEIQLCFEKVKSMQSIENDFYKERYYFIFEYDDIHSNSKKVSHQINLYYKSTFTLNIDIEEEIPRIVEIVRNPMKYNHKFEQVILPKFVSLAKERVGKHKFYDIIYHRYFKNLNYNNYVAERNELVNNDRFLYSYMINDFNSIFKMLDNTNVTKKTDRKINLKMLNFVENIHTVKNFIIQFKEAFLIDCDPLLKDQKLSDIFQEFNNYLVLKYDLNGAEYIIEFTPILVFFSRPQNLFSNLTFLNDFLYYPRAGANENLFQVYIGSFIDHANEYLNGISIIPKKFSPSFVRTIEINVFGDNDELITYVCEKFFDWIESDYKINKSDIESHNLLEIPFEFINVHVRYYFIGRIRIQQKLNKRYSVDSSKYDCSVVICCQKETSKEFVEKFQMTYSNFRKNIFVISLNFPGFPKRQKIDEVHIWPKSLFSITKIFANIS